MKVIETHIKGVKVIEPKVFGDHRGWFMETYSDSVFQEAGLQLRFVQDNHSFSAMKGTLRGLHYQLNPKAQTKLVRCTKGSIYDVAVDIRKGSPTFSRWFGIELSAENKKQLLIPKGFAHGFMTLTNDVEVQYKVDELYAPECDRGISWNDPTIGIEWPIEVIPVLSDKDKAAPLLKAADNNFVYGEQTMKVLVTGYTGQLGFDVVREGQKLGLEMHGTGSANLDITNEADVFQCVQTLKPDAIIHCAAYTAVDKAEDDKETCWNVNVNGTKYLVQAAKEMNAKFMYISTDYVFDGKGEAPFMETDDPNPIGYYGLTKYEGEEIVKSILDNWFIVRISWVFGLNGNNFAKTMLRLAETRNELNVVGDQYGSPTYTADLARLLMDMIQTDKYGTYHASNEGFCSWAEFASEIFQLAKKEIKVNSILTEEYPTRAVRPKNSRMSKQKIIENGFKPLPVWQDAVKRYIQELTRR